VLVDFASVGSFGVVFGFQGQLCGNLNAFYA